MRCRSGKARWRTKTNWRRQPTAAQAAPAGRSVCGWRCRPTSLRSARPARPSHAREFGANKPNAAERGMTRVSAQNAARRASRRLMEQRPGVACRTESGKTDHAADNRDRVAQHTHHSLTAINHSEVFFAASAFIKRRSIRHSRDRTRLDRAGGAQFRIPPNATPPNTVRDRHMVMHDRRYEARHRAHALGALQSFRQDA